MTHAVSRVRAARLFGMTTHPSPSHRGNPARAERSSAEILAAQLRGRVRQEIARQGRALVAHALWARAVRAERTDLEEKVVEYRRRVGKAVSFRDCLSRSGNEICDDYVSAARIVLAYAPAPTTDEAVVDVGGRALLALVLGHEEGSVGNGSEPELGSGPFALEAGWAAAQAVAAKLDVLGPSNVVPDPYEYGTSTVDVRENAASEALSAMAALAPHGARGLRVLSVLTQIL